MSPIVTRRRGRIAALAATLVAVVVSFLVAGLWLAAAMRPWLEESLGEALARPVQIGAVRPRVSLYPGLVLRDVSVANPSGSAEPVFLEVAAFEARLDLAALLRRELRIHGVRLRDGRLVIGGAVPSRQEEGPIDARSQLTLLRSLSGEHRLREIRVEIVSDDGGRSLLQLERARIRGCGEPAEARARLGATAIELAGTLDCQPRGPVLREATAHIGDSDLRGHVALRFEKRGLRVEVDADAEELLLDELLAMLGESPEDSMGPPLDEPLSTDWLGNPELDVGLRAGAIYAAAGVLRELDLRLTSQAGRLQAGIARARVAEGSLTGELRVDATVDPPDLTLMLFLDSARLALLAPDAFDDGTGTLDLEVLASGTTPRSLLASASGRAQLSLSEALLSEADLGVLGRDLFSLLPSAKGAERKRRIHCAVLRASLDTGTGALLATVDTPNTTLAGGGSLDLEALSGDLLLKPRPRRASLGAVKTPLRISGPLTALSVAVDKGELAKAAGKALGFALLNPLVALVDLGVRGNPCQEAIKQALGELSPNEATAPEADPPPTAEPDADASGPGEPPGRSGAEPVSSGAEPSAAAGGAQLAGSGSRDSGPSQSGPSSSVRERVSEGRSPRRP